MGDALQTRRMVTATWTMRPPHPPVPLPEARDRTAPTPARMLEVDLMYFMSLGSVSSETCHHRYDRVYPAHAPERRIACKQVPGEGPVAQWQAQEPISFSWYFTPGRPTFLDEDDHDLVDYIRCSGPQSVELGDTRWPQAIEALSADLSITETEAIIAVSDHGAHVCHAAPNVKERIALRFRGAPPELVRSCR